jgi:hypothetical protein
MMLGITSDDTERTLFSQSLIRRTCTNAESSVFSAGLNSANVWGGTVWWRLEFWSLALESVFWAIIGLRT